MDDVYYRVSKSHLATLTDAAAYLAAYTLAGGTGSTCINPEVWDTYDNLTEDDLLAPFERID